MKNSGATGAALIVLVAWPCAIAWTQDSPAIINIADSPIPIRVLAQSPADTDTYLQFICLFRSSPANKLQGSLAEINDKLTGLLDRVRSPQLFRGELGETVLLTPPKNSIGAKKLLIVGLGDSQTFSPQRMQLVGEIVYTEANRLGVRNPFFSPTVLDGGVSRFTTGQVAEQVIAGFLHAAETEKIVNEATVSSPQAIASLTYLAGQQHAEETRAGIEKAVAAFRKPR
jgi:Cytosol aminopeptidase family, N-terminal domain